MGFCSLWPTIKEGLRPKWTISVRVSPNELNMPESDKNKKCLYVILEFCLLCVVSSMSAVYTRLFRGLKYLLKVPYIMRNYSNVDRYLIFKTLYLDRSKTLPNVRKKYHKNERHLCLVRHNSTKLSQNMCQIDTHILIYWYIECDCKLWNALWYYCVFG